MDIPPGSERMDVDEDENVIVTFAENVISFAKECKQRKYFDTHSLQKYFGKPDALSETFDSGFCDVSTNQRNPPEIPTQTLLQRIDSEQFSHILQNSLVLMCKCLRGARTGADLSAHQQRCWTVSVQLAHYLQDSRSGVDYVSIVVDFVSDCFLRALDADEDEEFRFALTVILSFGEVRSLNTPIISVLLEQASVLAENVRKKNGHPALIFQYERDLRRQLETMMVINELRSWAKGEMLSTADEAKCMDMLANLQDHDDFLLLSMLCYKLVSST